MPILVAVFLCGLLQGTASNFSTDDELCVHDHVWLIIIIRKCMYISV